MKRLIHSRAAAAATKVRRPAGNDRYHAGLAAISHEGRAHVEKINRDECHSEDDEFGGERAKILRASLDEDTATSKTKTNPPIFFWLAELARRSL